MIKIETKGDLTRAVAVMAFLQDRACCVMAGADWKTKNLPFYRAAYVEAVEYIDHIGFKWWKDNQPDMANAGMEIVDILHFVLSDAIEKGYEGAVADCLWMAAMRAEAAEANGEDFRSPPALVDLAEQFVGHCATKKHIPVDLFAMLAVSTMGLGELYTRYVAKNALNLFRQANGDRDGTYNRRHNGVEDNDVVIRALDGIIDLRLEDLFDYITQKLSEHYSHEPS